MTEPYIDPETAPMLAAMRERMAERGPLGQAPVDEMRRRLATDALVMNADPPPLARVEDIALPGPFRATPMRLYRPHAADTPQPAMIYLHGGGWVVGDLDLADRNLRLLALASGATIVSIDYVLAPEHPFPAPLDDCIAALRHVHAAAGELGLDPARLALGGESAGANLALASAIALRDAGDRWLKALLLWYGVFGREHDTDSHRSFGTGDYGLSSAAMDVFWGRYLDGAPAGPLTCPLSAPLHGLPPARLVGAGLDPLRDDTRLLAARLAAAGGRFTFDEVPGVLHGFLMASRFLTAARACIEADGRFLKERLG